MKTTCLFASVLAMAVAAGAADFPIDIPTIPDVRVTDSFWGARMETNRLVTVPAALDRYEQAGRLDNFRNAAARKLGIPYNGNSFEDSDLYRILEGAFLACLAHPDSNLQARAEAIIPIIAAAQEPDGYLYTAHTIDCVGKERNRAGKTRWSNLQDSHELYCMGQLVEAALAHKQLTGKDDLMNVMWRNVDLVSRTFGNGRNQLKRVPGHESPEIALPKLWRFAHEPATMELIKNFINWRGRADLRPLYGTPGSTFDAAYYQDAQPVREQREAMGHAVRACYLYAGMAEMIALTGDQTLRPALDAIWQNVVGRKMYITGGVGACHAGEKFGADFELPNEKGYLETCAALANALWQFRMFRLDGDAKYIDVFERILYNNFAAGVSIGGDAFFYVNPLTSRGNVTRWRWHGCPCCPANLVRIVPQLGTYVYAASGDTLYWNLFAASDAKLHLAGGDVKVRQTNNGYPWRGDGLVLEVDPGTRRAFTVKVRIPGWARGECVPSSLYTHVNPGSLDEVSLTINGQPVAIALDKGYATVTRTWAPGDRIELALKMTPRFVRADSRVEDDIGRLAVERGPVVYCAEGVDNGGHVLNKYIQESRHLGGERSKLRPSRVEFLAETNVTICGTAFPAIRLPVTARTRGVRAVAETPATLTLVPYLAWSHRGAGEMQTWLPTEPVRAEPAFTGKASASHCWKYDTVQALTIGQKPTDSAGRRIPHFSFWPQKGTTEWVQYDLPHPEEIRDIAVYWLVDEATKGGCLL
ncbi:MAG: glycoside hydrolase family 127 protein, partial [Kiritimatiellae bacterium]|nr:glycoside hydrolase family 127 protein [Kiritimatiellia bacterium]